MIDATTFFYIFFIFLLLLLSAVLVFGAKGLMAYAKIQPFMPSVVYALSCSQNLSCFRPLELLHALQQSFPTEEAGQS